MWFQADNITKTSSVTMQTVLSKHETQETTSTAGNTYCKQKRLRSEQNEQECKRAIIIIMEAHQFFIVPPFGRV